MHFDMSIKNTIFVMILTGLMWLNYPQTAEARTVAPVSFFVHKLNTCNMDSKEIWKDVKGYEGLYQVSNLGNVYSLKSSKILRYTLGEGYCKYGLYKNGIQTKKSGHRLVMESFVENTFNKETVNHINGIKNDNRLVNLEWATRSENVRHAIDTGLLDYSKINIEYKYGKDNPDSLKVNQYDIKGKYIKTWYSMSDIERELGVQTSSVSDICNNKQSRKSSKNYLFRFFKGNESCNNIPIKTKLSVYNCRWFALPSIIKSTSKINRKVSKLDLNNNIINNYNSVSEAAKDISGFVTNICSVCNGKMNTYKGFKWKYTEEGGYH